MLSQLANNPDKTSTIGGTVLAAIIAAHVDYFAIGKGAMAAISGGSVDVIQAGMSQVGTLAGAAIVAGLGYLIGKFGKTPPPAAAGLIIALALLFSSSAAAQSITITVTTPKSTASAKINVFAAPTITALNCTPGDVLEGDLVTCVIQVDKPAPPVGYRLAVVYGIPIQGAPTQFLIPAGQIQATIQFPAPTLPSVAGTLIAPTAWNSEIERAMPMGSGVYGTVGGTPKQDGKSQFFAWERGPLSGTSKELIAGLPSRFVMIGGAKIFGR